MTTVGMRTTLTLDELDTVRACVRFMRQNYGVIDPIGLESIERRLEALLDHAAAMHYPADLTIGVRP